MATVEDTERTQPRTDPAPTPLRNGHDLVARAEWIPGKPPTDYEREVFGGLEYETRYWQCRRCGKERNRRDEFDGPCAGGRPASEPMRAGYSVDDPRTRRALTEDMTVYRGGRGPRYLVLSGSGRAYEVNVEAETCTCPDHRNRGVFCKHLRRVDIEMRTGSIGERNVVDGGESGSSKS